MSINLGDKIVELPLEMENNIRKRFTCSLGNSIYLYNWTNEKFELFIVDEMENWNATVLLEKPNYSTENTFAQTVISQKNTPILLIQNFPKAIFSVTKLRIILVNQK